MSNRKSEPEIILASDHQQSTRAPDSSPRLLDAVRMAIIAVLALTTLIVGTIAVIITSVLTFGRAKNFIVEKYGGMMGRIILMIAGVKLKQEHVGESTNQPAVYIANHSSTLDMFVVMALGLPRIRFVAKSEFLHNPIFAVMGKLTGQIFVNRQDSVKAVAALQRAYHRLQQDRLSLFFMPEGTRRTDGKIGPFKKGAFRMAMALQYPIVPMHFIGMRQLASGKSLVVRPGTVKVRFHPAVPTSSWNDATLEQNMAEIREQYIEWEREAVSEIAAGL